MAGKVRGIGEFHLYGDRRRSQEFAESSPSRRSDPVAARTAANRAHLRAGAEAKVIWAHTGFSVAD